MTNLLTGRSLTVIPSGSDPSDPVYTLSGVVIPPTHSLFTEYPVPACCPLDQGSTNSCTENALVASWMWMRQAFFQDSSILSRLFLYYYSRVRFGNASSDAGSTVRNTLIVGSNRGAPWESGTDSWPFDTTQVLVQPLADCNAPAKQNLITGYSRIKANSLAQVKDAINQGKPVLACVFLFQEWGDPEYYYSGNIPMPESGETPIGSHTIWITGYNDTTKQVTFMNSWGTNFGNNGQGTLPYAYIKSDECTFELWALMSVST